MYQKKSEKTYIFSKYVRKNHEQAIHKITKYMQEQGAIIDKCCRSKDDFLKEGDILVQNCTSNNTKIKRTLY